MIIVVHSGSRDNYQVALALFEKNMLHCLVTDYYHDSSGLPSWIHLMLSFFYKDLRKRSHPDLPGSVVKISKRALFFFVLAKLSTSFRALSNRLLECHNYYLSVKARHISISNKIAILAYSNYATIAFRENPNYKILFQMHPYCSWVVDRLLYAQSITPKYKSLTLEYEFTASTSEFRNLVDEPYLADSIICASHCTLESIPKDASCCKPTLVAPYGSRFAGEKSLDFKESSKRSPINVVIWGALSERKRFSGFLSVANRLETLNFNFHVAYRSVYDYQLLDDLEKSPNVLLHCGLNSAELASLLAECDVLFFPSWLEGFGHIVLEAMSFGLVPIVSKFTCGPDIIDHGVDGFIMSDDSLSQGVDCLLLLDSDRNLLRVMRNNSFKKTILFSEISFREKIAYFVSNFN